MKARSYLLAVATGAAACSVISWLFSSAAQKEWARHGAAEIAASQLHREISAVHEKLRPRGAPPKSSSDRTKPALPVKAATKTPWEFDHDKQIRRHPELQNLRMDASRALIRTRYQPLFEKRHLSSEQISAFTENVVNNEERQADISAALTAENLSPEGPEARKILTEVMTEFQNAQKKLLGDAAFAEWKEYERGVFFRQVVGEAAAIATVRGSPLASAQLEELNQAFLDSCSDYTSGGYVSSNKIDWKSLETKVSAIVSSEQHTAIFQTHNSRRLLLEFQAAIEKADKADRAQSE